jgi:hypothetical protein
MTDEEYISNIRKIETDELFQQLESFGYDPYYGDLWVAVVDELKRRIEDRPIIEKIVTKGGMTLALRKPDREISDFANVIADMLGDINVRELKDKFNTITFTDTNTGCIVKYCRVDDKEAENDKS